MRWAHFGQNRGWDKSRGARVFLFGKPRDLSGTSQRPIFTKFGHETYFGVQSMNPERHFEHFHFRGPKSGLSPRSSHLPPNSDIEIRSNRHLTQSRLLVTGCTAERYCLLRVIIQGPGSFRVLVNIFVRRTVAELPNFRILAYFHHTKRLKSTFR